MKNEIKDLTIYVIPGCPYCRAALAFLDGCHILYEKRVVPSDKSERKVLDQFTQYFPDDPRGVPVMVVTDKNDKKHYFNDETDPRFQELLG